MKTFLSVIVMSVFGVLALLWYGFLYLVPIGFVYRCVFCAKYIGKTESRGMVLALALCGVMWLVEVYVFRRIGRWCDNSKFFGALYKRTDRWLDSKAGSIIIQVIGYSPYAFIILYWIWELVS